MEMDAMKLSLVKRWREIEEADESLDGSLESDIEFRKQKEQWFSDALNFLIKLPGEVHIWCSFEEIMWPLLEPFCSFFDHTESDFPLRILWRRICGELQKCTKCIVQHHRAQELYKSEFEDDVVKPLLMVFKELDEERIAKHLKEINSREEMREEIENDFSSIISVLFEILMFPDVLEDYSVAREFEPFLIQVDKSHDLALSGNEQYPGVYALLFLTKIEARAVGFRLAGCLPKIKKASDLESIQPLIENIIIFLENSSPRSTSSRPRVKYEREAVWSGIKTLIGFLEPLAFEEGIVERYPIFVSLVLNHVSSDNATDFMHAVDCLRMLFIVLGCKLWLRTTFSSSVIRNTLLGQCFHTRIERHHKAIFDLFQPFLQSLEALQDGEFERQRRHILYFLLHQVSHSNNFSTLMKKMACQIAILVILRGYRMDPPCPPFEYAHMWAPSLIHSAKDISLFVALREPAFDLIWTIIVADATALFSLWHNKQNSKPVETHSEIDEDIDDLQSLTNIEDSVTSCWVAFKRLRQVICRGCQGWICIPLLWVNFLTGITPSYLPSSVSKAVFWALSRLSVIDPGSSGSVSFYLQKLSTPCYWDSPKGCDDGADGKMSVNAVKADTHTQHLIRLMRGCGSHYAKQLEGGGFFKRLTWEPRMSETVILMLLDCDDTIRQSGKVILEQVSGRQGLHDGLQFLCTSQTSVSAMLFGFKHAIKMLLADSLVQNLPVLQHFFFVTSKLLSPNQSAIEKGYSHQSEQSSNKIMLDGGFLRPVLNTTSIKTEELPDEENGQCLQEFRCQLSDQIWILLIKCLADGKSLIHEKSCQITLVRLLEVLPKVVDLFMSSRKSEERSIKLSRNPADLLFKMIDFKWLYDLAEWGRTTLLVLQNRWKNAFLSIFKSFGNLSNDESGMIINRLTTNIEKNTVDVNLLQEQLSLLSISLLESIPSNTTTILGARSITEFSNYNNTPEVIVLSDEEVETDKGSSNSQEEARFQRLSFESQHNFFSDEKSHIAFSNKTDLVTRSGVLCTDICIVPDSPPQSAVSSSIPATEEKKVSGEIVHCKSNAFTGSIGINRISSRPSFTKQKPRTLVSSDNVLEDVSVKDKDDTERSSRKDTLEETTKLLTTRNNVEDLKKENVTHNSKAQSKHDSSTMPLGVTKPAVNNIVFADNEDPLDAAFNAIKSAPTSLAKPKNSVKRQVIHLVVPPGIMKENMNTLCSRMKNYKPPRLDEWYKRILELDYCYTVGITLPETETENVRADRLTKVPTSFSSSAHYVDVFRPFLIEEFKAQLRNLYEEVSSAEDMSSCSMRLLSLEKVDDFQYGRFMPDAGEDAVSKGCNENDLVLLSRQPFQMISKNVHMIGKVDRKERDAKSRCAILIIRLYFNSDISRLVQAKRQLMERSKWCLTRLMSITPQLREFQALSAIKDNPLLSVIINPYRAGLDSDPFKPNEESHLKLLPEPLHKYFEREYNEGQLNAINDVLKKYNTKSCKLSLVQGPPGTGKTRTILAIVSSLLAMSKNHDKLNRSFAMSSKYSCKTRRSSNQTAALDRSWRNAAVALQLMRDGNASSLELSELNRQGKARVLVCAQSNAAVDELVSRICKNGLHDDKGSIYNPYIVRVGNIKTVHADSLPVFIDTLVDQRLGDKRLLEADSNDDRKHSHTSTLRSKLEKLVESIRLIEAQHSNRNEDHSNNSSSGNDITLKDKDTQLKTEQTRAKLNYLYKQKRDISRELAVADAEEKKAFENNRALRQDLRRDIIREAEIVITTLSSCGGDVFSACIESVSKNKNNKSGRSFEDALFDVVIIDEAAQALEPATLIPMQLLKPVKGVCVMVGDPKQLPATVLSNSASMFSYECSMFERLQQADYPVTMLSTQYRMHPEICRFPSAHFYDNQLKDHTPIQFGRRAQFHENVYLRPLVFYDVVDGREESGKSVRSQSLCNKSEVLVTSEILRYFQKRYSQEFQPGRIGIVTPYKQQLKELRLQIINEFGPSVAGDIEFNTVDGFQGREVDIVLFSTVRASVSSRTSSAKTYGIGFVSDVRRMNVALTRARFSLWIVGNATTLSQSPHWKALIMDVKERDLLIPIRRPYKSVFLKQIPDSVVSLDAKNICQNDPSRKSDRLKRLKRDIRDGKLQDETRKVSIDVVKVKGNACQGKPQTLNQDTEKGFKIPSSFENGKQKGFRSNNEKPSLKTMESKENNEKHPIMSNASVLKVSVKTVKQISNVTASSKNKANRNEKEFKVEECRKEKDIDISNNKNTEVKNTSCPIVEPVLHEAENNRNPFPSNVKDNFLADRKRQREAVDNLLLPGAFISNKKSNVTKVSSQKDVASKGVSSHSSIDPEKDRTEVIQKTVRKDKDLLESKNDNLAAEWELFRKKLADAKASSKSNKREL